MKNNKTAKENQNEESKSHFEKTQEGKKTEETNPNNLKASQSEQIETHNEIIKTDSSSPVNDSDENKKTTNTKENSSSEKTKP